MKEIYSRRSIRRYKPDSVDMEQIKTVLRAGMYAPSAGNERPWHFIIVENRSTLESITEFHPFTQMLKEAPMAIIVCADTRNVKYDGNFWMQDLSAAIENMLLQAEGLELGTCWCGVYPNQEFVEKTASLIGTPEYIIPAAIIAIGHPAETRTSNERYDETRVHIEKWEDQR